MGQFGPEVEVPPGPRWPTDGAPEPVSGERSNTDTSRMSLTRFTKTLPVPSSMKNQDVEPPHRHGVHGEEVAVQHHRGVGVQELTPRRPGSALKGVEVTTQEDVPDD